MGKANVDNTTMAVAVFAHEFGHVDDASSRPAVFQAQQEYIDALNKKAEELGGFTSAFKDPDVAKKSQAALASHGVSTWDEVAKQNDKNAETSAIPIIQQRFANTGKEMPESVRKAIGTLTGGK